MPAAERPNHRATRARPQRQAIRAFARCGCFAVAAPAIHRHANSGHNATTPGRINSRNVLGARRDPRIQPGDAASAGRSARTHAGQRVQLERRDDELGDFKRHDAFL